MRRFSHVNRINPKTWVFHAFSDFRYSNRFSGKNARRLSISGKTWTFPNVFPQCRQITAEDFRVFMDRFFIWTNFESSRLHDRRFSPIMIVLNSAWPNFFWRYQITCIWAFFEYIEIHCVSKKFSWNKIIVNWIWLFENCKLI